MVMSNDRPKAIIEKIQIRQGDAALRPGGTTKVRTARSGSLGCVRGWGT